MFVETAHADGTPTGVGYRTESVGASVAARLRNHNRKEDSMDVREEKAKGGQDRDTRAAEVLRRLDEIGAIKLDVLVSKSAEIQGIVGGFSALDPEDLICYPFMVHIGPRQDIDLVSVANQVRQLGFELKRTAKV